MSMFKNFILFILFFLVINIDAQQTNIKNISVDNGLPSNVIYDIGQDEIGYLWLATEKGLVKYDGDNFTSINKLKTTNLLIEENIIYTGLENGLFIKNKSKELFILSKRVIKIFSHKKNIFIGTLEGVYLLKEKELIPIKINSTLDFSIIYDIIYCKDSFYIASNNGLWQLNNIQNAESLHKITEDHHRPLIIHLSHQCFLRV